MSIPSIKGIADLDQFFHAYGLALAQWAVVEFRLCTWFEMSSGLTIGQAEAIFFSGRSFQTRAEMLSAALGKSKLDKPWTAFAQGALDKAIAYNSYRNQIAHGMIEPESYYPGEPDRFRLRKPAVWRESGGISRKSLADATDNFDALAQILSDGAWLCVHKHPPTAEFLERLEALPNTADSKSLSRKQRGRARQRQAARRSK